MTLEKFRKYVLSKARDCNSLYYVKKINNDFCEIEYDDEDE